MQNRPIDDDVSSRDDSERIFPLPIASFKKFHPANTETASRFHFTTVGDGWDEFDIPTYQRKALYQKASKLPDET